MPRGRPRKSTALNRGGSRRSIADHLEGKEQETVDIFLETNDIDLQPRRRSTRIKKPRKSYFDETVPETPDIEEDSITDESSQNGRNSRCRESVPEAAPIEDTSTLKDPTVNLNQAIIESCNTTVEPMEEEFWAITPPREEAEEERDNVSDGTQTLPPTVPTADYSQFSALETPFQLSPMPETADIRGLKDAALPEDSLPPTIPKADYDRYSIMEMPGKPEASDKTQEITESVQPTEPHQLISSQFSALETPFQLLPMPDTMAIRGKKPQAALVASLPPTIPKADYDRYSIMEMPEKSSEAEKNPEPSKSLPFTVLPLEYSQFSPLETPYALSALPIIEPKKSKNDNSSNWSLNDVQKMANKENPPYSAVLAQNYPKTHETVGFFEGKEPTSDMDNKKHDSKYSIDGGKPAENNEEIDNFRVTGKQNYDGFSISTSVSLTIHCNSRRRTPLQQRFPW